MDTNLSLHMPNGYYSLYKYISILNDNQIVRLSHIAIGLLSPSDFSAEEISALESKISQQDQISD